MTWHTLQTNVMRLNSIFNAVEPPASTPEHTAQSANWYLAIGALLGVLTLPLLAFLLHQPPRTLRAFAPRRLHPLIPRLRLYPSLVPLTAYLWILAAVCYTYHLFCYGLWLGSSRLTLRIKSAMPAGCAMAGKGSLPCISQHWAELCSELGTFDGWLRIPRSEFVRDVWIFIFLGAGILGLGLLVARYPFPRRTCRKLRMEVAAGSVSGRDVTCQRCEGRRVDAFIDGDMESGKMEDMVCKSVNGEVPVADPRIEDQVILTMVLLCFFSIHCEQVWGP